MAPKDDMTPPTAENVTVWHTIEQAAELTGRRESNIRTWLSNGKINRENVRKGSVWPYPTLLSDLALIDIMKIPRRPRQINPLAYQPAEPEG